MTRSMSPRLTWLMGILIVVAVLALDVPNRLLAQIATAVERGQIQAGADQLAKLDDVSQAFRLVARVARPGVVNIKAGPGAIDQDEWDKLGQQEETLKRRRSRLEKRLDAGEDVDHDKIWDLFNQQQELDRRRDEMHERLIPGTASGIVYDKEGHILTNNHVVDSHGDITVQLADQREYAAQVVGVDAESDLALIKIDAPDLHPLAFGDSDKMEVGDWVLAIGAPFGLSQTVTHGIVSARGRTNIDTGSRRIEYQDFIQTDAAINPGNSGGPLLNTHGEVIGINTAIATHGDSYNAGIAFTIPSNMAVKVAEQLKQSGEVTRGWLGVTLNNLEAEDMQIFSPTARGVLITSVLADSPAAKAGFQVEDLVVTVNKHPVRASEEMMAVVADVFPGETAEFDIIRGGQSTRLSAKLGRRPADVNTARSSAGYSNAIELGSVGVEVKTLRPSLAELNSFEADDRGAIVYRLDQPEGDVQLGDLKLGDLIVACDGQPVPTAGYLARLLSDAKPGHSFALQVKRRDGETRTIQLKR